ncbi:hypothetical protein FGL91_05275 [Microbacterium sp. CBA3102]|nr:hypothetical protein FGL91_05275 [Microbacterium sp. CBA3102]
MIRSTSAALLSSASVGAAFVAAGAAGAADGADAGAGAGGAGACAGAGGGGGAAIVRGSGVEDSVICRLPRSGTRVAAIPRAPA